jgi:hypothetical protein
MIARVWRGVVARDRHKEYVAYVEATGVAEYRRTPGCRVSAILTRELDGGQRVEVTAFSIWETEDHIRAFAGPDIDAMVLYPEDEAYLLEPPTLVHHAVASFDGDEDDHR